MRAVILPSSRHSRLSTQLVSGGVIGSLITFSVLAMVYFFAPHLLPQTGAQQHSVQQMNVVQQQQRELPGLRGMSGLRVRSSEGSGSSSGGSSGCSRVCTQTAVVYVPSTLEQTWAQNAGEWGGSRKAYCDKMTSQQQVQDTTAVMASIAQLNEEAIQAASLSNNNSSSSGLSLLTIRRMLQRLFHPQRTGIGRPAVSEELPGQIVTQNLSSSAGEAVADAATQTATAPTSTRRRTSTSTAAATGSQHLQMTSTASMAAAAAAASSTGRQLQSSILVAAKTSSTGRQLQASAVDAASHPTLSRFLRTYTCSGGEGEGPATELQEETFIEPLFGALRNPYAVRCDEAAFAHDVTYKGILKQPDIENHTLLMDVSYLLLEGDGMPKPGHSLHVPHRRAYYFDAGASLYMELSQRWMLEEFEKRGVMFDRIIGWEAKSYEGVRIFRDVPPRFMGAMSYFNVPLNTNMSDIGRNPLALIKHITRPEDFVVFKLDIDHHGIENHFLDQIASDPELYTRIDELYHEPHFNFEPLVSCCWKTTANTKVNLQGPLSQLQELRKLGIRAHGWP